MENQIFQDLKGLHLSGMAECWQNLQETRKYQEIVLQDGLVMLIQAEHDQRAANKTAKNSAGIGPKSDYCLVSISNISNSNGENSYMVTYYNGSFTGTF